MLSFLKYLLAFSLLFLVAASASWLILWWTQGARLLSVQSGSMAPTINRGDLIIDTKTDIKSLKPGDVISYYSPKNSGEIITHRVINLNAGRGYAVTQGDALTQSDPIVPAKLIIGRTIKIVPFLGYGFDKLHTPLGLIIFIYLPAGLICLAEVWVLSAQYKYRPYQLI